MKTTFLTHDETLLEIMRQAGLSAWHIADAGQADLSGEIISVGSGTGAKELAAELVRRGIADIKVGYVECDNHADLMRLCAKPKHYLWDSVAFLSDLPTEKPMRFVQPGLDFLEKSGLGWNWRIPELVVMAGPYSCGKSTMLQMLAAGFVNGPGRALGSGAMLCSWEDSADEVFRNISTFGKTRQAPDLVDKIAFVRRHPDEDRLISWYMDLVRYHHDRYGTKFFGLDPWNEMDHQKDSRQSETDYVRDMMKAFRRLVDKFDIILVVATHVSAKCISGDGRVEAFKIAQSFGSVNFANKADRGICIARTKAYDKEVGHTIVRLDKSKIERRMGRKGTLALKFNEEHFQFYWDKAVTEQVKDIWKD